MPETAQQLVNRILREFRRYTGDGLPGAPSNAPLPVGDPQSGVHSPKKAELRAALLGVLEANSSIIEVLASGGTANAQQAVVGENSNVDHALAYFMRVATENTGPMTLSVGGESPRAVVNVAGNPLSAGEWTGMVMFYLNEDGQYQLLIDAGAAASAAASAGVATDEAERSRIEADRAEAAADSVIPNTVIDGSVTPPKLADTNARGFRMASSVRGRVNFFDFLQETRSSAVREQIMNGTFTGDLATEWQAFRDALAAIQSDGGRPYGFIPECKILSSVAPNFAMDYLTLETQGLPVIEAIGTVPGFVIDGMGLGNGQYGVRGMNIGPLSASSATGVRGIYIRRAHMSDFWGLVSRGATFAGIQIDGCVTSNFHRPMVSAQIEPFITMPAVGLYASGTAYEGGGDPEPWHEVLMTSWCKFDLPIIEYTPVGIQFDKTFGNMLLSGTAEGCSDTGIIFGEDAWYNKVFGLDLEQNASYDLVCYGRHNDFVGMDSLDPVVFVGTSAYGNKIIGGHYGQVTFDANTKRNLISGANVDSITDNSTGPDRNRFRDIANNTGQWTDRWLTWSPEVVASTGSLTSASSYGEYKVRDGDTVDFQIELSITTNGTGAGELRFLLPFTPATDCVFSGAEIALSGKGVSGYAGGGNQQVSVRFADGTYPGADGAAVVVSGTYRRA